MRRLGSTLILILIVGLTGCAAMVEDEQKVRIHETFDALPPDVATALHADRLKIHAWGPTATDGYGERKITLPPVPPGRGTKAAEIATCRAAVRAFSATSAGLYFHPHYRDPVRARVTEPLCERGLVGDDLNIGVPGAGGQVLDTEVHLDLRELELQAWGFGDVTRGLPMALTTLAPAEVDPPLTGHLPWTYQRPKERGGPAHTFVVPRGTRLQAIAECPPSDPPTVIVLGHATDPVSLTFEELVDPKSGDQAEDDGMVRCGQARTVPLVPLFSYTRGDGQEVDVLRLDLSDRRNDDDIPIRVRVEQVR